MLDTDIRTKLTEYLEGEINLVAFQEWFVPETWNIQNSQPAYILDLAYSIQLKLAEYTNGHLTENDLREFLRTKVDHFTMIVSLPTPEAAYRPYYLTGSSRNLRVVPNDDGLREAVVAL